MRGCSGGLGDRPLGCRERPGGAGVMGLKWAVLKPKRGDGAEPGEGAGENGERPSCGEKEGVLLDTGE